MQPPSLVPRVAAVVGVCIPITVDPRLIIRPSLIQLTSIISSTGSL